MPKEKEAGPGRSAPKNSVSDNQPETTPEKPKVKGSRPDMVAKAETDAALWDQQSAEEAAKEKFNAVLDELKKPFPDALPVFVACHRASKKPVAPWKGLNQDNWAEPDNLRLLARQIVMGGNLAIKLGRDSHKFVAVDLDHDRHTEPFLQANPAFRNTLRTRGSKGAQFWFYAVGDYPQEVRKLEINGTTENAGEFRGGKCISIIWGVHQNGNLYSRVNDVPPIQFAYRDIICPAGWRVIEPKNNFKLRGNGNRNTGPPTPTGRRGNRRVDWDKFNAALRNGSGRPIVRSLVERWFGDAVVEGGEWSCGDITGRAQNGRGSFHISPEGLCIDFDGSWSRSSVVNAIASDYRSDLTGENVTIEDVFEGIREDTGEDFFKTTTGFDRYNVWYVKSKEKFLWCGPDNTWSLLSTPMVKEQLRVVYGLKREIPRDETGKPTDNKSEVETVVSDAIQNRRVDFNLRGLAGHEAGVEQLPDGTTYMIERSGRWVEPEKGDWSPIERLINGLFREGQAEYVLGNLCIWVRDYYAHDYAPRPAMVFAGPQKCAKNLFQEIVVTGILGGTFVDPTQYMTSVTSFNSDLSRRRIS
jgi:hypothetical protein